MCYSAETKQTNMVDFEYKIKNRTADRYTHSPCFSYLRFDFKDKLEHVKYFIDCKVSEEIATKYLKFLNRLFGKLVKVEYTYPKVTLSL